LFSSLPCTSVHLLLHLLVGEKLEKPDHETCHAAHETPPSKHVPPARACASVANRILQRSRKVSRSATTVAQSPAPGSRDTTAVNSRMRPWRSAPPTIPLTPMAFPLSIIGRPRSKHGSGENVSAFLPRAASARVPISSRMRLPITSAISG